MTYLARSAGTGRARLGDDLNVERIMFRSFVLVAGVLAVVACNEVVDPTIERPTNLTYKLDPSGNPDVPAGILLTWDPVLNGDLEAYNIYSRQSESASYDLRGSTTSLTFHDVGEPDLFYAVTALFRDGDESDFSDDVFIDERLRLTRPSFLNSTSLDGAIHLAWDDSPFQTTPEGFLQYRVYSTIYSLDDGLCAATWSLEGTSVSPEFLAAALVNGQSRCFAVAAESIEGWESLWSEKRADTPRPDARNVVMFPLADDPNRSGFRFYQDIDGDGQVDPAELGIVGPGGATTIDFWVFRDATDSLFLVPERAGTGVEFYESVPVDDLTSVDIAPDQTYRTSAIIALPGFGYVFEMDGGDGFARYGAIRITHVSRDLLIFDWSYQTDPGNPELQIRGGLPVAEREGVIVTRR